MPDVTVDCAKCGNRLYIIQQQQSQFRVEPCKKCLGDAEIKGYDEGYDKGFEAAEDEMEDT